MTQSDGEVRIPVFCDGNCGLPYGWSPRAWLWRAHAATQLTNQAVRRHVLSAGFGHHMGCSPGRCRGVLRALWASNWARRHLGGAEQSGEAAARCHQASLGAVEEQPQLTVPLSALERGGGRMRALSRRYVRAISPGHMQSAS